MRFHKFVPLGLLALLAACASPEQDAKRAAAICEEAGHGPGEPGAEQCISRQVFELQEKRQDVRAAIADGLQAYGSAVQSTPSYSRPPTYTPMPIYRAPINCSSYQLGHTTQTQCY